MSAHAALIASAVCGGLAVIIAPVALRILFLAARAEPDPDPGGPLRDILGLSYPAALPLPPLPADVGGQLVYLAPADERHLPDVGAHYLPTYPGTRVEIGADGSVSFHEPEPGQ